MNVGLLKWIIVSINVQFSKLHLKIYMLLILDILVEIRILRYKEYRVDLRRLRLF